MAMTGSCGKLSFLLTLAKWLVTVHSERVSSILTFVLTLNLFLIAARPRQKGVTDIFLKNEIL